MRNNKRFERSLSKRIGDFAYEHNGIIQLIVIGILLVCSISWSVQRYNSGATVCYDGGVSVICEHK